MSRRFVPPKNSGKINGGRRDERARSDRVGHHGIYDGTQPYQLGGHYEGEERREERNGRNRGGAGRDSEDRLSSHRHRGNDHRYDDRRRHGNHSPRGQLNVSEHLESDDDDVQRFERPEGHNGYYPGDNPHLYGGQNEGGERRRKDVERIGRSRRGSDHAKEEKKEEREADSEEEEDEDEKTEKKLEEVRRLIRKCKEALLELRELGRDMIEAGQVMQKLEENRARIRDCENELEKLRKLERVALGKFQGRRPMRALLATPLLSPIAPAPLLPAVVRSPTPPALAPLPPAVAARSPTPPARAPQVSSPRPHRDRRPPARYRDTPSPAPAQATRRARALLPRARAAPQVPGPRRSERPKKPPARFDV